MAHAGVTGEAFEILRTQPSVLWDASGPAGQALAALDARRHPRPWRRLIAERSARLAALEAAQPRRSPASEARATARTSASPGSLAHRDRDGDRSRPGHAGGAVRRR